MLINHSHGLAHSPCDTSVTDIFDDSKTATVKALATIQGSGSKDSGHEQFKLRSTRSLYSLDRDNISNNGVLGGMRHKRFERPL